MKTKKLRPLLQGLRNIQSKHYCELSEKEHLIIERVIKIIEKIMKPKKRWPKVMRKISKTVASFIIKMF